MQKQDRVMKIDSPTLVISSDHGKRSLLVKKAKLMVLSGPLQGKEFLIEKEVFAIGADLHNDLVVEDSSVSKRHCEILLTPDGYLIRDLGSTNGTVIHGVRVREAFLNQSTEFQMGKTRIVFSPMRGQMEYTLSPNESFGALVGKSMAMRRVFHLAETYAPTDATILIEGETGTGKEVLAEEIHRHSKRKDKPFIVIDCAALARDLIESELFGHVKGSFTGAAADRMGAFESADGGTVFLDEIVDLSADLQPKLLRVLEKKEIRRVGSNKVRPIDVRVISAANRRLENGVNTGKFREDLYYRLSVVHIDIAPLRTRKEDLPLLTRKFLKELHGEDAISQVVDFDKTMEAFGNHDWPGNVRELRNLLEIAFLSGQRPVNLGAFLYLGRAKAEEADARGSVEDNRPFKIAKGDLIRGFEKEYVERLLDRNEWNVSKAAREAGIERAYLQRLIRRHDLKVRDE